MRFKNRIKLIIHSLFLLICSCLFFLAPMTVSAATIPVTVMIPVTVEGKNTDETFTCVLDMESTEFQTVETTKVTLRNGQGDVFQIRYTCPGTYSYTIRQEKGSDRYTTYDDTVYAVDVYVTEDEKGQLFAEPVVFIRGNDEKQEKVHFSNVRQVPSSGKPTHTGNVNTGDTTEMCGYYLMLGLSGIVLILAGYAAKKRRG